MIKVGFPQSPDSAGNGGRNFGIPLSPWIEAISAVSSPFDHPEWERFQNHPIHERPRIALVAVADDKLGFGCLFLHDPPFCAGRKPRAAASSQAGLFEGLDDLHRLQFLHRAAQGDKAFMRQVFLKVERIDMPEILGGDMHLPAQKRVDGGRAFAHGVLLQIGFAIGEQGVQQPRPEIGGAMQQAASREMAANERGRLRRRQVGVEGARLAGYDDLDHRRAMAHPHAADALDGDLRAAILHGILKRMKEFVAALRDAARAEAHENGGPRAVALCGKLRGASRRAVFAVGVEVANDLRHPFGGGVADGDLVQLHHRGEGATAQAGDRFNRVMAPGIGVVSLGNIQVPPQGVFHAFRPGDVAGRAATDPHD